MAAKYIYIANQLRAYLSETTKSNVKLPTEHELCIKYNVSRQTVRKALSVLADEQLITKKQGSGSYLAKNSSNNTKNTIALIISSTTEYIYPELVNDIKTRASQKNYELSIYTTDNNVTKEREILKTIMNQSVSGVIIEGCNSNLPTPNADLYHTMQSRGISVIFLLGCYPNLNRFPSISYDNYSGCMSLCQLLISNNHQSIACIFQNDTISGIEKYYGYTVALRDSLIPINDSNVFWYSSSELNALEKYEDTSFLTNMLTRITNSSTAIICQNDEIAYWIVKECKKLSLSIPDDISIVCFNNTYLNSISDIPITTLSAKPHELGHFVVDQLLLMIHGHLVNDYKIPLKLVDKKSIKPQL